MLHADTQLAGTAEDIQFLITKVPGYITDIREIVEKGGSYIPQIKSIVVKAGAKLPQINDIVIKGIGYLPTIQSIVEDPSLPVLVERIKQLRALESKARTEAASAKKPQPGPPGPVGVGLHRFVKPLDAYIWTREHPTKTKLLIAGGVLALIGGSVMVGRWTKRCR
jgi:hypothetical protein